MVVKEIGIFNYFNRREDPDLIKEIDLMTDQLKTSLMRKEVIETVVNLIADHMSLIEWNTLDGNGKRNNSTLYYRLNIKPNANQNAVEFWNKVINKLIFEDGEALIIVVDNQLVVADSFFINEFAIKSSVYKEIIVGNFKLDDRFSEDVIYLNRKNRKISALISELDRTYGELFSTMLQVSKRFNQIRGTAKISGMLMNNKNARKYLQSYVDSIFKVFNNQNVAIAPEQEGLDYKEHNSGGTSGQYNPVETLGKVREQYMNQVLEAMGINPKIVYGDYTEQEWESHVLRVVQPIVELIEDEINAKMFSEHQILKGEKVKASTVNLLYNNVLKAAQSVEKLVGSRAFTPNEIREEVGYDAVDDDMMNQFYLTKNIEVVGGDNTERSNNTKNDEGK